MDEHIQYLNTLCRLCGTNLPRTGVSAANKESFKSELWMKFRIYVDLDSREIHPSSIKRHEDENKEITLVESLAEVSLLAALRKQRLWFNYTN